jgi:hypothetical protein
LVAMASTFFNEHFSSSNCGIWIIAMPVVSVTRLGHWAVCLFCVLLGKLQRVAQIFGLLFPTVKVMH